MKTTESTGLPTMLREVAVRKMNAGFIELTKRHDKRRVMVYPKSIVAVVDDGEVGCAVFFGDITPYLEVRESYDEVKRRMEEANR